MIHCNNPLTYNELLKNPNSIFNRKDHKRAGIIPFSISEGITYLLLGFSKEKKAVWADLGGRVEPGETVLETALREFGEESRHVLPVDLNNIKNILVTGNFKQVIFFIQVSGDNYNINDLFQSTVPQSEYEDEMQFLQWIPYDTFLTLTNISNSLRKIQKLLISLQ